jgi:hypothetical protein
VIANLGPEILLALLILLGVTSVLSVDLFVSASLVTVCLLLAPERMITSFGGIVFGVLVLLVALSPLILRLFASSVFQSYFPSSLRGPSIPALFLAFLTLFWLVSVDLFRPFHILLANGGMESSYFLLSGFLAQWTAQICGFALLLCTPALLCSLVVELPLFSSRTFSDRKLGIRGEGIRALVVLLCAVLFFQYWAGFVIQRTHAEYRLVEKKLHAISEEDSKSS